MNSRSLSFSVLLSAVSVVAIEATAARADVSISDKATQNMSCAGGVCTPTAKKATLNVSDLTNMLASGDVTVNTGGSLAKDIDISAALSWASTSRLTLDAFRSVTVKKPVSVTGTGALTITTNDGGKNGEFIIEGRASVQFWDLNSSLIIDGRTYNLVGDIKTLANDIAGNPSGLYAFAKPYDASVDGTYTHSPVPTTFTGSFEGLGNAISNLKLAFSDSQNVLFVGLFAYVGPNGTVRNVRIADGEIDGRTCAGGADVGLLAGGNDRGFVEYSSATGLINILGGCSESVGGLVGASDGMIFYSHATVQISATGALVSIGGLVNVNAGLVSSSYTKGTIVAKRDSETKVGGLVGDNESVILNAYSLNSSHEGKDCCGSGNAFGGMIGNNGSGGTVGSSYAAGKMGQGHSADANATRGGFVGIDDAHAGSISNAYWDLDKGIGDPSQGAGNIENDSGITGLTTQQLQSGLPAGFDPKIWGQNLKINNGFPYLLVLPPK